MDNQKMNRRVFLAKTGKAIGLGVLAHFTLIGRLCANDSEENVVTPRKECGEGVQNSCLFSYTCDESKKHSCESSFTCASDFTCKPVSSNNCKNAERNKCEPVEKFKVE